MTNYRSVCCSLILAFAGVPFAQRSVGATPLPPVDARGALAIVGGGGTPGAVFDRAIELAGGERARVVVLPQASDRASRGVSTVRTFQKRGVRSVELVELEDPQADRKRVSMASLIWFPGGSQSKLIARLEAAGMVSLIRHQYRDGAVVGGTSAGAAVMAESMIPTSPEEPALRSGHTPRSRGLGVTAHLIDQHFVERKRMTRLLSAVIDEPERLGFGIGERTALIVLPDEISVMGDGSVVLIDARQAAVSPTSDGELQRVELARLSVLRAGDRLEAVAMP